MGEASECFWVDGGCFELLGEATDGLGCLDFDRRYLLMIQTCAEG